MTTRHNDGSERSKVTRMCLMAGAALVVIFFSVLAIRVILEWPFTREAVTVALQDRFARTVEIRNFRSTYFPPGFIAEGAFMKKKSVTIVPFTITGTSTHPAFALDFDRKRKL